jgi:hypothetical protein
MMRRDNNVRSVRQIERREEKAIGAQKQLRTQRVSGRQTRNLREGVRVCVKCRRECAFFPQAHFSIIAFVIIVVVTLLSLCVCACFRVSSLPAHTRPCDQSYSMDPPIAPPTPPPRPSATDGVCGNVMEDDDDDMDFAAGVSVSVPLMTIRVRKISVVMGDGLVPVTDQEHAGVSIQVRAWLSQHLERLGAQIKRVIAHTLVHQQCPSNGPSPRTYGKEIVVQSSRTGPVENPGMILVDSIHADRKPKWVVNVPASAPTAAPTAAPEEHHVKSCTAGTSDATTFLCWMTMVAQDPPQPNEMYVVALAVDSCVARTHPTTKAIETVCRVVPIGDMVHVD